MIKDYPLSTLHRLLFSISSKESYLTDRIVHTTPFVIPAVDENWLIRFTMRH